MTQAGTGRDKTAGGSGFWNGAGGTLVCVLLAMLLATGAGYFVSDGLDELRELRHLERTPRSMVAAVLPGEVSLQGQALAERDTVRAPESGTPSLYVRHLVERRESDSEGKKRWVVVSDRVQAVPFLLDDGTGTARILHNSIAQVQAPRRYQQQRGSMRYSEYRIESADTLFVYGWAEVDGSSSRVVFNRAGQYRPIISTEGELAARQGMAEGALLRVWVGLTAASFAVFFFAWVFRIHVTALYLVLLGIVLIGGQAALAVRLADADLVASQARLERDMRAAHERVETLLSIHGEHWNGNWQSLLAMAEDETRSFSPAERQLLRHLPPRLVIQSRRTAEIADQFPERWVARWKGLPPVQPMTLAREEGEPVSDHRAPVRLADWLTGLLMVISGLIAFWAARFGLQRIALKRLIEDMPVTPTRGTPWGLAEVKGLARPVADKPLPVGPVTGEPCLWYRYKKEERHGSGKNARWVTLIDRRLKDRFWIEDHEGRLPVDPDGAQMILSPAAVLREGRFRSTEWRITPDTLLYLLGSAGVDPQTGQSLRLHQGDAAQPFLITDREEDDLVMYKARGGFAWLNLSLNAGNGAGLAMIGGIGAMHGSGFMAAALVPLVLMTLLFAVLIYNGLVVVRQRVLRAWANIAVSLQKRADLVPNLEQAVKAFLSHESGLQQDVIRLRQLAVNPAHNPASAKELVGLEQSLLSRVRLIREAYPELQASALLGQFMRELVQLENEVALMRVGYNDSVERYHTRCQQFPELLLARVFGFAPQALFEADLEVQPEIKTAAEHRR